MNKIFLDWECRVLFFRPGTAYAVCVLIPCRGACSPHTLACLSLCVSQLLSLFVNMLPFLFSWVTKKYILSLSLAYYLSLAYVSHVYRWPLSVCVLVDMQTSKTGNSPGQVGSTVERFLLTLRWGVIFFAPTPFVRGLPLFPWGCSRYFTALLCQSFSCLLSSSPTFSPFRGSSSLFSPLTLFLTFSCSC